MRAWARRYRQAYRVLPAAPHATDGARPTQPSRAPHATAARSGPHAAVLAACHAHGRTTLGLRDRPTPASAAPLAGALERGARRHEAALINKRQVVGRASGVCCERCWAVGVGMRNLRLSGCPVCPAVRYARLTVLFPILVTSGDTNIVAVRVSRRLSWMHSARVSECHDGGTQGGYEDRKQYTDRYVRLSGCPAARYARLPGISGCPAARYARLPGMSGCPVCPAVRLPGCPVCPAVRYARLSGCPAARYARLFDGALRVEGSPTPGFSGAAGGSDRARRATARDNCENNRQVSGRASGVRCEPMLGRG